MISFGEGNIYIFFLSDWCSFSFSLFFVTRVYTELWSTTPARIAGLGSKGSISTGKDADFVVFDPDGTFVVNDEMNPIFHKHNKTAYDGQTLRGVIHATFLRGREIYAKDVKGVRWPAWGQVHLKK